MISFQFPVPYSNCKDPQNESEINLPLVGLLINCTVPVIIDVLITASRTIYASQFALGYSFYKAYSDISIQVVEEVVLLDGDTCISDSAEKTSSAW